MASNFFKNRRFKGLDVKSSKLFIKGTDANKILGAFSSNFSEIINNSEEAIHLPPLGFRISRGFHKGSKSFRMQKLFNKTTQHYAAQVCILKEQMPLQPLKEKKADFSSELNIKVHTEKIEENEELKKLAMTYTPLLLDKENKKAIHKAYEKVKIEERKGKSYIEIQNEVLLLGLEKYLCHLNLENTDDILKYVYNENFFILRTSSRGSDFFIASGYYQGHVRHSIFRKEYIDECLVFKAYNKLSAESVSGAIEDPKTRDQNLVDVVTIHAVSDLIKYCRHNLFGGGRSVTTSQVQSFQNTAKHNRRVTLDHEHQLSSLQKQRAIVKLKVKFGSTGKGFLLRKNINEDKAKRGSYVATGLVKGKVRHFYYKKVVEGGKIQLQRLNAIRSGGGGFLYIPGKRYSSVRGLLQALSLDFEKGSCVSPHEFKS